MTPDAHPRVVEVFLTWGVGSEGWVLATKYVREGEAFVVGEAAGADVLVPREVLGRDSVALVTWDGAPVVLPTRRSRAWVDGGAAGAEPLYLADLAPGSVVDVAIGAFTLRARLVEAVKSGAGGGTAIDLADARGLALSAAIHASLIILLALRMPALERSTAAEIEHEASATREHLLAASAQREAETPIHHERWRGDDPARGRAPVEPVRALPHVAAAVVDAPVAVGGPARETGSRASVGERAEIGRVGASFAELLRVDPNESNPWKDATASLDGHVSQTNALFADDAPDRWGVGGVTLSGVGEGAAAKWDAIPLKSVGGLTSDGIQAQIAAMDPNGFGHVPSVRHGVRGAGVSHPEQFPTETIPASVIAGVMRANAGRFAVCLGIGLRKNPQLAGRVDVAFTIGVDGVVTDAHDEHGEQRELADEAVRACVVKTVFALTFPPPPRGRPMRTTYPFQLGLPQE